MAIPAFKLVNMPTGSHSYRLYDMDGNHLRYEDEEAIVARINQLGQEIADGDDTTPRCTVTWFKDGGRTEVQCSEPGNLVCKDCAASRCDEHNDGDHGLVYYQLADGTVICEECISDEDRADSQTKEAN